MANKKDKIIHDKAAMYAMFTGYFGVFVVDICQFIIPFLEANSEIGAAEALFMLTLSYIFIGLPIASFFCLISGPSILNYLQEKDQLTALNCITFGLLYGAILWLVLGYWFIHAAGLVFILIDAATTILFGGLAGWVAFKTTTKHMAKRRAE